MSEQTSIECPVCKKTVSLAPRDEHFPFCTERCRTIDLGRWLDDRYMVDMKTGTLGLIDEDAEVEEVDPSELH